MIQIVLILISLVVTLLTVVHVYFIENFKFWKRRGIRGPRPIPLFGNVPNAILMSRNSAYDIDDIYRKYKDEENFVGIFFGKNPALLILDPQIARDILVTNYKNFQKNGATESITKDSDPIYGRNHFFLNGTEWKEKRNQITPAFTCKKMATLYPITRSVSKKINVFLEANNSTNINVKELALTYTAENVSDCVYGVQAGAFTNKNSVMKSVADEVMGNYIWQQTYSTILSFPIIRHFFLSSVISKNMGNFFEELTKDAIDTRKRNNTVRDDFLQHIIYLKDVKGLRDIDLTSHSAAIFLDGYESSGITISQCLNMLARHKNVQDRLRSELKTATEINNGTLSYTQLMDIDYLDQCVNETLRLFTPGKDLLKYCTTSCTLVDSKGKDVEIKEGDLIMIPLYSIQRDERFYSNPNEFDPDRFSPEFGGVKRFKEMGVFLPFGDGPRICSGLKFAIMQIKTAISEIILNWEVKPNFSMMKRDIEMSPTSFVCLPKGGVWLHFQKVD